MLLAEKLLRRIGDTNLLDNISLQVESGQRIGLVGESGSGKSTLMRALVMLDPCDSGTISYAGNIVSGGVGGTAVPAFRRKVGYLNQRPAMIEGSVEDNLRLPFNLEICREAYDRDVAVQLLSELKKLPSLIDQDAGKLSGGEQQLVALVRAILAGPQLLLLDEPTASLDPGSTTALERFLTNWIHLDSKRSWIWASHDADQVARMTDRVLFMKSGKIIHE